MKRSSSFLILMTTVLLFSCADYSRKYNVKVEYDEWRETQTAEKNELDKEWWKNFEDDKLSQIIETARNNNQDVQIALTHIDQARANEAAIIGENTPIINASVGAGKSRNSRNISNSTFFDKYSNNYNAGFDATWEIDLFGLEPAIRAGSELTNKSIEDYNNAMATVLGEVGVTYFDLRKTQMQLSLQLERVNNLEEKLELQRSLLSAGKIDGVELAATESENSSVQMQMEIVAEEYNRLKYQLELLSGVKPGAFDDLIEDSYSYNVPTKELVAGAPAEVLSNRPDVRSAERNLYYSGAVKDIAVTNLLPKISLTGLLGFQSSSAGNLISSNSVAWNATGSLIAPIIDYKKLHADILDSDAKVQEAVANYNKAVLSALSDVETSFSAYNSSNVSLDIAKTQYESVLKQEEYMDARYSKGFNSYIEFIDSKNLRISDEINLEDAKFENLKQLVRVYKALGGGW